MRSFYKTKHAYINKKQLDRTIELLIYIKFIQVNTIQDILLHMLIYKLFFLHVCECSMLFQGIFILYIYKSLWFTFMDILYYFKYKHLKQYKLTKFLSMTIWHHAHVSMIDFFRFRYFIDLYLPVISILFMGFNKFPRYDLLVLLCYEQIFWTFYECRWTI